MVESSQNRIYHRLNQLQIESTMNRINYRLNLPMIESTYGCREGRKSKKVKNPANCRTFALYQTKVQGFSRIPGSACTDPRCWLYRWVLRASELESWKLEASWELQAGNLELNYKNLTKLELELRAATSLDCHKNLTAVEPL